MKPSQRKDRASLGRRERPRRGVAADWLATRMVRLSGWLALAAIMVVVPAAGAHAAPVAQRELDGWAVLTDRNDREVGVATFTEDAEGVHIEVRATGLPPGPHGIHIDAVGSCVPPTFASAGGHFNPGGREHGIHNLQGVHAGDLENLLVDPDGTALYDTTAELVTLGLGNPAALLFDGDGSALVIDARPDDYITDPDGNSGPHIACGEIVPS